MPKQASKKSLPIVLIVVGLLVLGLVGYGVSRLFAGSSDDGTVAVAPTPVPEPVNLIPVSERPFVTMRPASTRNDILLTIHDLKKPADSVEVVLEYDRNEGVLDAVLQNFPITNVPFEEKLFMGSKSAGGHITYHDDVIGGTLELDFEGDEPYRLSVPWRYDDTERTYSQISTADGKFQVALAEPLSSQKMLVMQSPGLPENIDGEVLAGPYLFSGVGPLPDTTAQITMRLSKESSSATLYGWTGDAWEEIPSTTDGKQLTANADTYEVYVVVE